MSNEVLSVEELRQCRIDHAVECGGTGGAVFASHEALRAERDSALAELAAMRPVVERMEAEKNNAYAQRNKLAVLLAAKYGGSLVDANPQEPGWSSVLLIPTGSGQISFHVHDSELPYVLSMPNIKMHDGAWDGHDDGEKWRRVERESSRAGAYRAQREGK